MRTPRSCGTKLRYGVGAVLNRPQLHKFPNWEIGNLKLRLKVTGVEAQVELLVGVKLGIFETP